MSSTGEVTLVQVQGSDNVHPSGDNRTHADNPECLMNARRMTLLVAGLAPPLLRDEVIASLNLPALRRLHARAQRGQGTERGLESVLYALSGYRGGPPVAAFTRLSDTGMRDTGYWLRADPVHLQVRRGGLILLDNETIALNRDEAQALIDEILRVFGADGWHLEAPVPHRWYLKPPAPAAADFVPIAHATGQDINDLLPRGPDAGYWRRALNEIQMLLTRAPANEAREARGDLPVNSVWFWGGGALPARQPPHWTQIWTDDSFAHGLALWNATPVAALPPDATTWLGTAGGGNHVVLLTSGAGARQYRDIMGWRDWITQLDEQWLAPILKAVTRAELAEFTMIDSSTGASWTVDRRGLNRWWRRPSTLTYVLGSSI